MSLCCPESAIRHALESATPARFRSVTNRLLDTILDRSVVGGYTKLGYLARHGSWSASELQPMGGKVVLVSGATSGLGLAAADGFARLGASVRLLVRSAERGEHARQEVVARSGNDDVAVELCDLSELHSVRAFAERFAASQPRLDVLVNNAGALLAERRESSEGIELTFATNVLGPFLMTNLLLGLLSASSPARVINVSSGGMYTQSVNLEDLQSVQGRFDGAAAYARTKRAQVMLTEEWARRLHGSGVVVHAMHPGWVDTPGLESSLPRFYAATKRLLRTPEEGADTIVWLGAAVEPGRSSGGFWHDRRRRPTNLLPWTRDTEAMRLRLWDECERLCAELDTPDVNQ